jgi:hypothetical protein
MSNFTFIDLKCYESNYQNPQQLQIDTKDCENFVWLNFKAKTEDLPLDKIDQSIYQNPIIQTIKKEISTKDRKLEELPNKDETSEDDYKSAENEINLGDDDYVIEKCEKNKEELKSNLEAVHKSRAEINNEIKNENLIKDNSNQIKNDIVKTNDNENLKQQDNVNSSNRVFDKIFSEMKQELKNSNICSNSKEENKTINKSDREIKKQEDATNNFNEDKSNNYEGVAILNTVNNPENKIEVEVKCPIIENISTKIEGVVNNLENLNNGFKSNYSNHQNSLDEKNKQEFLNSDVETKCNAQSEPNNMNNFLPEPPKELKTEENFTQQNENNNIQNLCGGLNDKQDINVDALENKGNLLFLQ